MCVLGGVRGSVTIKGHMELESNVVVEELEWQACRPTLGVVAERLLLSFKSKRLHIPTTGLTPTVEGRFGPFYWVVGKGIVTTGEGLTGLLEGRGSRGRRSWPSAQPLPPEFTLFSVQNTVWVVGNLIPRPGFPHHETVSLARPPFFKLAAGFASALETG